MLNFQATIVFAVTVLLALSTWNSIATGDDRAEWIWGSEPRKAGQQFEFRKSFSVSGEVISAELRGVADFSDVRLVLNGNTIDRLESYSPLFTLDIAGEIKNGRNELLLECSSVDGPAAVFVRIELTFEEGAPQVITTDATWQTRVVGEGDDWTQSTSFGRVADEPWGVTTRQIGIDAFDDYEQWKQALNTAEGSTESSQPSSFQIAPGFEIELVRSATKDEGSWVSMAVDPKGRIVIAREDAGLLRMTLSQDGSTVEEVETIEETLKECRGVLFAFDSLYVNANNSKGFYRLRDTDGDDQFDEVNLLKEFPGGVGHGRNDLTLGPDNKIYLIHGDSVEIPADMKDFTSPFRERRLGDKISSGHLIRTDRNGEEWELLVAGMRNPFGVDFNSDGQAYTYDADAEFDMGAPWYRATNVMHLATGSDFGWRAVTGKWPPYFHDHPDNAPLTYEVGKGSPTAVKFGTNSNFPLPYKNSLFILDWAYGRIVSVHMTPRGAGYACRGETFLKGRPLNVTDLDFTADGSMYFVTGGRKTQAGLYRVKFVGNESDKIESSVQQIARIEHARQSRKTQEKLNPDASIDLIWQYLASADPTLRAAARVALEHHPVETWKRRALDEKDSTTALNALMALARLKDRKLASEVLERLNRIELVGLSATWKLIGLHTYLLCLEAVDANAETNATTLANIRKLYGDSSPAVNREVGRLLVMLADPNVVEKLMPFLTKADNQREQLYYLFLLRNVREGWTREQRRIWFQTLNQSDTYVGGQGLPGFLKKIREEAVSTLTDDEKEELASVLKATNSPAEVAIPERTFVKRWTLNEILTTLKASNHRGDIENGRAMFTAAACARCHRVGAVGTLIGPDLTAASSRYSRRDLLEAIISPSKVIAPNYASVLVETVDGQTHSGRVVLGGDYRDPKLRLATDPNAPHKVKVISKSDIVDQSPSNISWMPEGLLNTLSVEEILDLLTFIEAGQTATQ